MFIEETNPNEFAIQGLSAQDVENFKNALFKFYSTTALSENDNFRYRNLIHELKNEPKTSKENHFSAKG